MFDPQKALCILNQHQKQPITDMCNPKECQNACIEKKHKPLWLDRIDEIDGLLKTKGMNEYQTKVLIDERNNILFAINQIDEKVSS